VPKTELGTKHEKIEAPGESQAVTERSMLGPSSQLKLMHATMMAARHWTTANDLLHNAGTSPKLKNHPQLNLGRLHKK